MEVSSQPNDSAPFHGYLLNKSQSEPQILFGRYGEEINETTFLGYERESSSPWSGHYSDYSVPASIIAESQGSVNKWRPPFGLLL
jgi:hypothetical protein